MDTESYMIAEASVSQGHRRKKNGALASVVVSLIVSIGVHFLGMWLLDDLNFSVGQVRGAVAKPPRKVLIDDVHWFKLQPIPVERKIPKKGDLAENHEKITESQLRVSQADKPLITMPVVPKAQDVPTPEMPEQLSDAALADALKTIRIMGVDNGTPEIKKTPELYNVTAAEVAQMVPETVMVSVPEVNLTKASENGADGEHVLPTITVPGLKKSEDGESAVVVPKTQTDSSGKGMTYVRDGMPDIGQLLATAEATMEVTRLPDGVRYGDLIRVVQKDDKAALNLGKGARIGEGGSGRGGRRYRQIQAGRQGQVTFGVKIRLGKGIHFETPELEDEDLTAVEPGLNSEKHLQNKVRLKEGGEDIENSLPLDGYVKVDVRISPDAAGGGYYQVFIEPTEQCDELRDVAKDVLFILDHSTSIGVSRLMQFKEMTIRALSYLNPSDRFNVIGFTSKSTAMFDGFVAPREDTLLRAQRGIQSYICAGTTDIFGGIGPYVSRSNKERERPLIVFLLTDGQSTVELHKGDVEVDNTRVGDVLRVIAQSNPGNVSVYPFSAGEDADRVLLDFLARLNRGTPYHAVKGGDFRQELGDYLRVHTSLVVRNFRYIAEGDAGEEIYPRTLPHLYRAEPLSIYGHYTAEQDTLVLSLLGYDAEGKLRRLVFERNFADCELMKEDGRHAPLSEQWTAQKALHLLAEWVVRDVKKLTPTAERKQRSELISLLNSITAFSKYSNLL